ncbi:MAG TPA: glycosyltransferase family 4 protein, partial [Gemmatimonadaceae bacterium]
MLIGMAHPSFTTTGGAELLAARHAEYLRSMGHEVRLVTMALDPDRWPQLVRDVDVRVVGKRWTDNVRLPNDFPKHRRRAVRQAAELRGVQVVLAENYPANVVASEVVGAERTVWYCNEPSRRLYVRETFPTLAAQLDATPPGRDSALLAHARRMFARHATSLRPNCSPASERIVDAAAVARLSRVIGDSAFAAELVRRVYGRTADAVVYPTIPLIDPPRRSAGVDSSGLRVLVHARLELLKNVETVLLGFAAFRDRHPGAHELHVVGRGPDAERLHEVTRERGLREAVHFHGFLTQRSLEQLYARCDVMALLPIDEPFGMVFPEA